MVITVPDLARTSTDAEFYPGWRVHIPGQTEVKFVGQHGLLLQLLVHRHHPHHLHLAPEGSPSRLGQVEGNSSSNVQYLGIVYVGLHDGIWIGRGSQGSLAFK